jgi:hypothetical protein
MLRKIWFLVVMSLFTLGLNTIAFAGESGQEDGANSLPVLNEGV